eukprot:1783895-Prymnesium_polylepis.2
MEQLSIGMVRQTSIFYGQISIEVNGAASDVCIAIARRGLEERGARTERRATLTTNRPVHNPRPQTHTKQHLAWGS